MINTIKIKQFPSKRLQIITQLPADELSFFKKRFFCEKILPAIIVSCLVFLSGGCLNNEPLVTGSGVFEAVSVLVSPEVGGRIESFPVDEGSALAKGDVICRVDTSILEIEKLARQTGFAEIDAMEAQAEAEAARAQAVLDGAQREYQRAKTLQERGSIPQQRLDDAETAYTVARRARLTATAAQSSFPAKRASLEAAIAVIDDKIARGTVVSPLNSVVIEKYFEPGEMAVPGRSLVKLADLSEMWIRIYIPGSDLDKVHPGSAARIYLDGDIETALNGRVTWVAEQAEFTPKNAQTRDARAELVYAVKVTVTNSDNRLKIGMPADVCLEGFPEYDRHPHSKAH